MQYDPQPFSVAFNRLGVPKCETVIICQTGFYLCAKMHCGLTYFSIDHQGNSIILKPANVIRIHHYDRLDAEGFI